MLDIDHFKWINDTHGHLAGDEVLRAVTGVFRRSIREADVLLRYGGEEFLVVLPDADIEAVVTVGERLRAAVEKASVSHEGKSISLTVSIGATAYIVGQTDSEEQMLAEADAAMYAAKNSGRDRLCAYRTRSGECVPASAIVGVA
jgi:diguanylate cyclase (GGDEF)-like protein